MIGLAVMVAYLRGGKITSATSPVRWRRIYACGRVHGLEVPILFALLFVAALAFSADEARAQTGPTVRGSVVQHGTGIVVEGANVTMVPVDDPLNQLQQVSGRGGAFVFDDLVPGLYIVSVTMPGYMPLGDSLRDDARNDLDVILPIAMTGDPVELEAIVVEVSPRPVGPMEGFERRRVTMSGIFMDRAEIDRSNPQVFTDLIRRVPGARLVPAGALGYRVRFRGGCVPDLWLDGTHVQVDDNIDSFLAPHDLEAVEVYRGPELPGEFGTNLCGAIVAWTRRGQTEKEDKSLKMQFILAGSFVALVWLIRR